MSRLVDERADLYSLGAVFYELLTGLPPFSSGDPVELVHAHLARSPVAPRQLNPAVPSLLSDLVMKLLAKMPEKRYQSAEALAADLTEASARLATDGSIAPFELGLLDLTRELPLPDRLFQRDCAAGRLCGRPGREARDGRRMLVALAGPAGVGKSALARTFRADVLDLGGPLLAGAFERRQSHAPYAAFAEALRARVRALLAGTEQEVEGWRSRLREALGPNARVISDVCPELDQLLGDVEAPGPAGPAETETRFRLTFQAFLQVLAGGDRPLTIVLDDVHWADAASAGLLRHLLTEADLPHLLVVVAFRTEAGETPPLAQALLTQVEAAGTTVQRIAVPALDAEGLTAMIARAARLRGRAGPAAGQPGAAQDRRQPLLRAPAAAAPAWLGVAHPRGGGRSLDLGPGSRGAGADHRQRDRSVAGTAGAPAGRCPAGADRGGLPGPADLPGSGGGGLWDGARDRRAGAVGGRRAGAADAGSRRGAGGFRVRARPRPAGRPLAAQPRRAAEPAWKGRAIAARTVDGKTAGRPDLHGGRSPASGGRPAQRAAGAAGAGGAGPARRAQGQAFVGARGCGRLLRPGPRAAAHGCLAAALRARAGRFTRSPPRAPS